MQQRRGGRRSCGRRSSARPGLPLLFRRQTMERGLLPGVNPSGHRGTLCATDVAPIMAPWHDWAAIPLANNDNSIFHVFFDPPDDGS